MRLRCGLVMASSAVAVAVLAGSAGGSPTAREGPAVLGKRCAHGFVDAVVSGKHQCLRRGQRCARRLDRQYHRYGFHCHRGRLTGGPADLALSNVAAPDPVLVGALLTYTLTIQNGGPAAAAQVTVVDPLPPSSTYVSSTSSGGSCSVAAATVTCALGTIAADDKATVTLVVRPTEAGTISNEARVTSLTRDTRRDAPPEARGRALPGPFPWSTR
jgi:uncharacterized repeat protein (TIGR01451 family)